MVTIHPRCVSKFTDELCSLAVKAIRLDDLSSIEDDLHQLFDRKPTSGSPLPVSSADQEFVKPFLLEQLGKLMGPQIVTRAVDVLREIGEAIDPNQTPDEATLEHVRRVNDAYAIIVAALKSGETLGQKHRTLVREIPEWLAQELARRFVLSVLDQLKDLPFEYGVIVRLPFTVDDADLLGAGLELDTGIKVVQADEEMLRSFGRLHFPYPVTRRQDLWQVNLDDKHYYLYVIVNGYWSLRHEVTESLGLKARDKWKEFVGLCVACDLLTFHERTEDQEILVVIGSTLEQPVADFLPENEAATHGGIRATPRAEMALPVAKRRLHAIARAFRNCDAALLKAGRWYFDSLCSTDRVLRLLQVVTTLEILLGNEGGSESGVGSKGKKGSRRSEEGLQSLLATRCAYLVSTSRPERERVEVTFKAIYDARSRASHGGVILRDDDILRDAVALCRRVIQKEIAVFVEVADF